MTNSRSGFFLAALSMFWMLCGSAGGQNGGISANGKQRALLLNVDSSGRQVVATVGQKIEITLQTIGPGSYEETPQISSPAIRFENVHSGWPQNPGGPTQVYIFRAAAQGKAEIQIPHINSEPMMRPTFVVTIKVRPTNPE
ncbi:MAG TPA: hypothetical protein VII23_20645 [Terriglobales bacterium]